MNRPALSFTTLLTFLIQAIETLIDPRRPSNNHRYSLQDVVLSAFSAFFMQSESFLEHQRHMQSRRGRDNMQTLFGVEEIASTAQIRNILDGVGAKGLFSVFSEVYQALHQGGFLQGYQTLGNHLLVALDGSEYHSSSHIHCPGCSQRKHHEKMTYFHSAVLPAMVHPDQKAVISLPPEFITPQDSHGKQDCESEAAKRWLVHHRPMFQDQSVTLLGDDLYSRQPLVEHCFTLGFDFIFVCLPQSHPTLENWIEFLDKGENLHYLQQSFFPKGQKETWVYRYSSNLPLREQLPAASVQWLDLTVTRERDGQILYHNSWVTSHPLNPQTLPQIAAAGRSRWKTENGNHNILKTRGYHLEHNFGHGQHHLSEVLLTLNLLAFLFHTVLEFVDEQYKQARRQRGTRRGFFQDLLTLTKFFIFESWTHLMDFLLEKEFSLPANSS